MEDTLTVNVEFSITYVWLVVAWATYFCLHSLLASYYVKDYLFNLGMSWKKQRMMYNILSALGLLAILFYNGILSGEPMLPKHGIIKITAMFLGGGGVLVLNAAFKQYNLRSFLGISEEKDKNLKKSGILNYVRHPIYSATILIALGFFLFDSRLATLVSTVCIFIYLIIGIKLEEKKLTQQFGQPYSEYKHEVPAVFPDILRLLKHITK